MSFLVWAFRPPVRKVKIPKGKRDQQVRRIHGLAVSHETRVRRLVEKALALLRNDISIDALERALLSGSQEKALSVMGLGTGDITRFKKRFSDMWDELMLIVEKGAIVGASASIIRDAPEVIAKAGFIFDIQNPEVQRFLNGYNFEFINGVQAASRKATRQTMIRGFSQGTGIRKIAVELRDTFGLTSTQERWVSNFKRQLQTRKNGGLTAPSDRRLNAIDRARAGRQMRTGFMTPGQIDELTEKYYKSLRNFRATTIARTESRRAAAAGQEAAWIQAADEGLLDRKRARKFWSPTPDERVRETHRRIAMMNPLGVPLGQSFKTPWGVLVQMPPAEVNCRCSVTIRELTDEELGITGDVSSAPTTIPPAKIMPKLSKPTSFKSMSAKEAEAFQTSSEYKDYFDTLSADSANAVWDYTKNEYITINKGLRGLSKIGKETQGQINSISSMFEGTKGIIDKNIKVYRSGSLNRVWKEGEMFVDEGFTSTSLRKSSIGKFGKRVNFEIRVPKGSRAVPISELAAESEYEVLLDKGTRFKVVKVHAASDGAGGTFYNVVMEVVPHPKVAIKIPKILPKISEFKVGEIDWNATKWTYAEAENYSISPKYADFFDDLPERHFKSLKDYTSQEYAHINDGLRGVRSVSDYTAADIKNIGSIFRKKVVRIQRDSVVYRKVDSSQLKFNFQKGKVFTEKGYTSTSFSEGITGEFSGDLIMEIRVPANSRALPLQYISGSDEIELLLNKGSRFRVIDVIEKEGEIKRVILELLL